METGGNKTLIGGEPLKEPSWLVWTLMKSFRTLLLTGLWTGLGMGAGLFCGILGVMAMGAIQHRTPDMSMAYRLVSIPVAIVCGSCALLWNVLRVVQAAAKRRRGE